MLRTRNRDTARQHAASKGHCYAISTLDGYWYAGTRTELAALGCANIYEPSREV